MKVIEREIGQEILEKKDMRIVYDDPCGIKEEEKCRQTLGYLFTHSNPQLFTLAKEKGFSLAWIPETKSFYGNFPKKLGLLSYIMGLMKVYSEM